MTIQNFFQKISKDLLISFVITYFLLMIPELILPGLVSSHFSPKYLFVAILALGWLFAWQEKGSSQQESIKFKAISRNILNSILFLMTIMLILSLYKMKIWQILVVLLFSMFLVVAAEHMLIEKEK